MKRLFMRLKSSRALQCLFYVLHDSLWLFFAHYVTLTDVGCLRNQKLTLSIYDIRFTYYTLRIHICNITAPEVLLLSKQ